MGRRSSSLTTPAFYQRTRLLQVAVALLADEEVEMVGSRRRGGDHALREFENIFQANVLWDYLPAPDKERYLLSAAALLISGPVP